MQVGAWGQGRGPGNTNTLYTESLRTFKQNIFVLYLINSEAATIFCKIHLKYVFKLPMKKFIFT